MVIYPQNVFFVFAKIYRIVASTNAVRSHRQHNVLISDKLTSQTFDSIRYLWGNDLLVNLNIKSTITLCMALICIDIDRVHRFNGFTNSLLERFA